MRNNECTIWVSGFADEVLDLRRTAAERNITVGKSRKLGRGVQYEVVGDMCDLASLALDLDVISGSGPLPERFDNPGHARARATEAAVQIRAQLKYADR